MKSKKPIIYTSIQGSCDHLYVHFNSNLSSQEVLRRMLYQNKKTGFMFATCLQLDGFLARFPSEQENHLIVALGSTIKDNDGDQSYFFANFDPSGSQDYTAYKKTKDKGGWPLTARFLLVRKTPLIVQWREELGFRDGGITAQITWQEIKKHLTFEEQVRVLEEWLMPIKSQTPVPMTAVEIMRAGFRYAGESNMAEQRRRRRDG